MTKTIFRLISSGVLAVLTGLWIFLAKSCPAFWFRFYPALSRRLMTLLSGLTSALPIPVCEILALLAALWLIFTFVRALHRKRFVRWLSGLLLAAVLLVNLYVSVWGLNYFAPPVNEVLQLPDEQYTTAQLRAATEYFRELAGESARLLPRNADGTLQGAGFDACADSVQTCFETMKTARGAPFDGSTARVKKLLSSRLCGKLGTTGVFVCLTGESCVSSTSYPAALPLTMAHEMAHRLGFAREDEANFVAVYACLGYGDANCRYSAAYLAYIYCYNSLAKADPTAASEVAAGCSDLFRADLDATTEHYEKQESKAASEVFDKVYDGYLKSFSVESGVQSYGEVTDLLLNWFYSDRFQVAAPLN